MSAFLRSIKEPLELIRSEPYHFLAWWTVAIVLGMVGFWLPILLTFASGGATHKVFENLVNYGGLASFGVVILADGIATTIVAVRAGLILFQQAFVV